jgi:hypothetical protein
MGQLHPCGPIGRLVGFDIEKIRAFHLVGEHPEKGFFLVRPGGSIEVFLREHGFALESGVELCPDPPEFFPPDIRRDSHTQVPRLDDAETATLRAPFEKWNHDLMVSS